jgi:hypothetical protein
VPTALKRAAQIDHHQVRGWAYRKLAERALDVENHPLLEGPLLAGLKDPHPQVRQLVADQIRHNKITGPTVVQALVNRVADDLWGERNPSPPDNFIHNPRADGGKNAALDALEELSPKHVAAALRAAARSTNPDVKIWAQRQLKNRKVD